MKYMDNKILSVCMSIMTPIILIFGFYIQLHGEVSPGGGFQSGIIFAIPFIIYIVLYGDDNKTGYFLINSTLFKNVACTGVLIYGFTGILTIILGGRFLEYFKLFDNKILAQQVGVFAVESGVCLAVFGSMGLIFNEMYKYIIKNKPKSIS